MQRAILAGLILVAAATFVESPAANAQVSSGRNPWCIRDGALGGGSWDCTYRTFEQCRLSAEGAGGSCSMNPNYQGGARPNARQPQPGIWGWGGGGRW